MFFLRARRSNHHVVIESTDSAGAITTSGLGAGITGGTASIGDITGTDTGASS